MTNTVFSSFMFNMHWYVLHNLHRKGQGGQMRGQLCLKRAIFLVFGPRKGQSGNPARVSITHLQIITTPIGAWDLVYKLQLSMEIIKGKWYGKVPRDEDRYTRKKQTI